MGVKYLIIDIVHRLRYQVLVQVFSEQYLPPEIFIPILLFKQLNLLQAWILIIAGIFDLNQKWKLYLYFFSVTFCLSRQLYSFPDYVSIVSAGLICMQIYKNLILPTINHNILYFCGIASYFVIRILKYIVLQGNSSTFGGNQIVYVLPAAIIVSYVIIKMRIQQIKSMSVCSLRTPTLVNQYVAMLDSQLNDQKNIHSYLFMHLKTCCRPNCFCHEISNSDILNPQIAKQSNLKNKIMNGVFHQLIYSQNWNNEDRIQIIQTYITFLVSTNQLIRAIQIQHEINENQMSFFSLCFNHRTKGKLKANLDHIKYFDKNRLKLELICNYDSQVGFLTKQIREILFHKIRLWKQLCKQNPQIKFLQKEGRTLVDRIQNLHKYFIYVVRPSEETLSIFKATILYGTYLVLTTNYTQFANSLVKKTKKLLEESKGQIFANGKQNGIFLKVVLNHEKMVQSVFQLVIANISTDFCQMIKKKKGQMLFKPLTMLIPEQFIILHCKKLDEVIKNRNIQVEESKFIKNSQQLPFLIGGKQIVFLNMTARLQVEPLSGSIFMKCLVQRTNSQMKSIITDLNDNFYYMEQDNYRQSLNHPTIKSTVQKLKQGWEQFSNIQKTEQTVIDNDQNMTFIFQPLFCNQLQTVGLSPLIRIGWKKESLKKQVVRTQIFAFQNKVKNIQGIMGIKQNDSQTSNSSRKDSIQNILNLLTESSSLKTQVFLTITLLTILVCSIIIFQIFNNFFVVWDTNIKQKNPVFTQINFIKVKVLLNKALSWNYDIIRYENRTPQTEQLFKSLYGEYETGSNNTITQIGRKKLYKIFEEQKILINKNILSQNNEVSLYLEEQMKRTLPIKNPDSNVIPLDMSLSSILANLLVEVFLLSQGKQLSNAILSFAYLSSYYSQHQKVSESVKKMLQQQMQATSRNIIIIVCVVTVLYFVFVVPIYKFNVNNKKKIEKIYSLLASLQTKLILQEIKKLQKVENQIATIIIQKPRSQRTIEASQFPSSQILQTKQKNMQYDNMYLLYEGISKIAVQELQNNSKEHTRLKIRKRVGEIVVEGSNCDKKKIRKEDWFLLAYLFLFIGMIHLVVWHKVNFIKYIDFSFKDSFKQIKVIENYGLGILNSKVYSDNYKATNKIYFQNQDLRQWIGHWIQQNTQQSYSIQNKEVEIQKCYQSLLLCKQNFSEAIFQSIIKKQIINSFDITNKILDGENIENVLVQKVRFQLFFAQQLQDFLMNKKLKNLIEKFTEIENKDKRFQMQNGLINIIFFLVASTYIAFSILYTIKIKKNYVKQVTLLSILNKQMLFNNKRVESFLHQLSKKT